MYETVRLFIRSKLRAGPVRSPPVSIHVPTGRSTDSHTTLSVSCVVLSDSDSGRGNSRAQSTVVT